MGATRAAQYIAANRRGAAPPIEAFETAALPQVNELLHAASALIGHEDNVQTRWEEAARRMSRAGGPIRSAEGIREVLARAQEERATFFQTVRVASPSGLGSAFRLRDMLLCQEAYLAAMADYIHRGGKSRGSALYTDPQGKKPRAGLSSIFAFTLDDGSLDSLVQEVLRREDDFAITWREVRPIPEGDDFFENVWRAFRQGHM